MEIALHSIRRVGLCFSVQCLFKAVCMMSKPVDCFFHSKQRQTQRYEKAMKGVASAKRREGFWHTRQVWLKISHLCLSFLLAKKNVMCAAWKQWGVPSLGPHHCICDVLPQLCALGNMHAQGMGIWLHSELGKTFRTEGIFRVCYRLNCTLVHRTSCWGQNLQEYRMCLCLETEPLEN